MCFVILEDILTICIRINRLISWKRQWPYLP